MTKVEEIRSSYRSSSDRSKMSYSGGSLALSYCSWLLAASNLSFLPIISYSERGASDKKVDLANPLVSAWLDIKKRTQATCV